VNELDLSVNPEDEPVADTVFPPVEALVDAEYENVTVQEPEVGVQDCEFADVKVIPLGRVPTATVTGWAVPCVFVIVTVCEAVEPCVIVTPGTDNE
jgi:hypothetical protein